MLFNNERNSIARRNYDSMFSPLFDDLFSFTERTGDKLMKTDITENEDNYLLELDVPSYSKEEIALELDKGYLTVKAEHTEEKNENERESKKGKYLCRERSYSSLSRTFYVGDEIKEEDVSAELDKGTLKVVVNKRKPEIAEKKKILIK